MTFRSWVVDLKNGVALYGNHAPSAEDFFLLCLHVCETHVGEPKYELSERMLGGVPYLERNRVWGDLRRNDGGGIYGHQQTGAEISAAGGTEEAEKSGGRESAAGSPGETQIPAACFLSLLSGGEGLEQAAVHHCDQGEKDQ